MNTVVTESTYKKMSMLELKDIFHGNNEDAIVIAYIGVGIGLHTCCCGDKASALIKIDMFSDHILIIPSKLIYEVNRYSNYRKAVNNNIYYNQTALSTALGSYELFYSADEIKLINKNMVLFNRILKYVSIGKYNVC